MKIFITMALFMAISIIGHAQQDSLTTQRFFEDSVGNKYMTTYVYADDSMRIETGEGKAWIDSAGNYDDNTHHHYIARCSIVWFRGNQIKLIAENIKAIYSPVECSADCPKLWLTRLYNLKNKKQ